MLNKIIKNNIKSEKAITLIALVITIIVTTKIQVLQENVLLEELLVIVLTRLKNVVMMD